MGFWSGLGKIALKAAPIAAAFIPGIGPLASMAIGGATGAASKKLSGGSWKDAALSGAIGAGTSAIPVKGIGPSAGTVANTGVKGTLGNIGKAILKNPTSILGSDTGGGLSSNSPYGPTVMNATGSFAGGNTGAVPRGGYPMRGLGPTMGQRDQSNPNLAESIGAGRQTAIRNQPFRFGYDVNTGTDDSGNPTSVSMPPIYPTGGRRKKRQPVDDEGAEE